MTIRLATLCCFLVLAGFSSTSRAADDAPAIRVDPQQDRLRISIGGKPFADYVFRDEKILRPYFTNVRAPGGVQVTRHHPPRNGKDSTDHATMHPGLWLAFGDISGADFWRNKARVEHAGFVQQPKVKQGTLTFAVRNRYRDGEKTICAELCTYRISARPNAYLLISDSQFTSDKPFWFGDQEEMGLGVRVASELRVQGGNGRILNSDGKQNEKQVRGTNADWCDYSGVIDGQRAGITLMSGPDNFRKSWYHARDYGFAAANPFGRNALTGGSKSKVTVMPGKPFRLQFGVLVHASPLDKSFDLPAAYRDFVKRVSP